MAGAALRATNECKKLMKFGLSIFGRGFKSSKCKTMAKMATARIKLLKNKREVVVRQMRRDVALLLQSRQDATARIRVEHVIREQNIMAATEIIELFCELLVARLAIIAKQRECPADLKEGISSLIFAAPRCSDIPELLAIRNAFEKKYGKDFVSAATDLRPNCGVNRTLIEKLSVKNPTGELKLKVIKEIAKEYQIEWDTTETEMELLKPPEELIDGPCTFVSATSMPVKSPSVEPAVPNKPNCRSSGGGDVMQFENTTFAAEAAAESAKQAIAAAQAAAYLANRDVSQVAQAPCFVGNQPIWPTRINHESSKSTRPFIPNDLGINSHNLHNQSNFPWRTCVSQNFERPHYLNNETGAINLDDGKMYRRHSYNAGSLQSEIKFDESDCDEEIEMEEPRGRICPPPNRAAPAAVPSSHAHMPDTTTTDNHLLHKQDPVLRIHPKLPDYDALAARFEALKYRKSQN